MLDEARGFATSAACEPLRPVTRSSFFTALLKPAELLAPAGLLPDPKATKHE